MDIYYLSGTRGSAIAEVPQTSGTFEGTSGTITLEVK